VTAASVYLGPYATEGADVVCLHFNSLVISTLSLCPRSAMIDERTVYNYNRLSVCAKLIRLGNCIGTIVRLFCKTSVCWFSVTTTKMKARQVEFIVSYCNKHSSSRPISAPHRLIKQKAQQGGSSLPPARTACCGLPATKITRL